MNDVISMALPDRNDRLGEQVESAVSNLVSTEGPFTR